MATRTATPNSRPASSKGLVVAQRLTFLAAALAALASALGLLVDGLYRDNAWVVPQNRGTDLVTLVVALPVLLAVAPRAAKGSARATVIWLALLGYLFYVYTGAAFAYAFNPLFLVYVALFSLTVAAIIALATAMPRLRLQAGFGPRLPRRAVALACAAIAVLLSTLWLGQILPFLIDGTVPQAVRDAGGGTSFVFVLDLGIMVPLAVLAALWTWRRELWGYLIAGYVLVKTTTMGLALIAMSLFLAASGPPLDVGLLSVWIALALGAAAVTTLYLRAIRPASPEGSP